MMMSEQDMLDYLKVEQKRMNAATFFCPACRNWQLKISHTHCSVCGGPNTHIAKRETS